MDNNDNDQSGDDSLGRAANRYVTYQIVSGIVAVILFLIFLFAVILPQINHANNRMDQISPVASPGTTTVTVDGRPATPEEQRQFEKQINSAPPVISTPPASH